MFAANLNNCKDERWANSSYALHILYIYYSVPVVGIFRPQVSTKRHANILFPLCIIIVIVTDLVSPSTKIISPLIANVTVLTT